MNESANVTLVKLGKCVLNSPELEGKAQGI